MRITLRNAIARSGQTQRALARIINSREARLSEIVRGWAVPTPEERQAIAAALGRPERGLFRNEFAHVAPEDPGDATA